MPQDQIGRRIGHIVLKRPLGKGGMGEVYEGWDDVLERRVAVKTLLAQSRLSESSKARFRREARILSQLDNSSICRIFDLIEKEDGDFLVLEFVEGETLDTAFATLENPEVKLRIIEDLALALVVAHGENIVHRDLKPQNVMVRPDGLVTVLDFGIARSMEAEVGVEARLGTPPSKARAPTREILEHSGDEGARASDANDHELSGPDSSGSTQIYTREGAILGTASFMSPEQAAGETATAASDIFSLGVILYGALTGRSPYGDVRGPALLLRVYRGAIEPPGELDPPLAQLLLSMLEVEPRARPTAQDVADQLRSIRLRPARRRRRRFRLAAAGLIALLVLGAVGVAIHARWTASQKAQIAQRFAGEARDLEWLVRAEHLTPSHDISGAYRDVRERILILEQQIVQLGDRARGPGLAAIGRAHLALSEPKRAHKAFSEARSIGWQNPEIDFADGIAMGELYRLALIELGSIQDREVVSQEKERLRLQLREPALMRLRAIRGSEVTFPEYVEGLIALYEERFADVLTIVEQLHDVRPWFYEAHVLAGSAEYQRGVVLSTQENNPKAAIEAFNEAQGWLQKAAEVGRSDPSIARLQCEVAIGIVGRRVKLYDKSLSEEVIGEALHVCDGVLDILPNDAKAIALKSLGEIYRGSTLSLMRKPAADAYWRAIALSEQVLKQSPDLQLAMRVNGWAHTNLAWEYFSAGDPATASEFEKAIAIYEQGMTMPKNRANITLNLASAFYGRGAWAYTRGDKDAASWFRPGVSIAEAGLQRYPKYRSLAASAANSYCLLARENDKYGEDPLPAAESAVGMNRVAADGATDPEVWRNLGLALVDLGNYERARGQDPVSSFQGGIEAASKAVELNPNYGLPQHVRGMAYCGLAEWATTSGADPGPALELAIVEFHESIASAPIYSAIRVDVAGAYLLRARLQLERGESQKEDVKEGLRLCHEALGLDAATAAAYQVRSGLLLVRAEGSAPRSRQRSKAIDDAIAAAKAALNLQPENAFLLKCVAEAYFEAVHLDSGRTGQEDCLRDGRAAVEQSLSLHPFNAAAWVLKARFECAAEGGDIDAARQAIESALELNPTLMSEVADLAPCLGQE